MKKLVIVTALITCFFNVTKAQTDYCKEIKKTIDEMKGKTSYSTPAMGRLDDMVLVKYFSPDGTGYISIQVSTNKENAAYDVQGLYIKFTDGTILRFGRSKIDCSYLNIDDHYLYSTSKLLEDDDLEPFKTKKIASFQIADKTISVNDAFATKFMAWANCIIDLK